MTSKREEFAKSRPVSLRFQNAFDEQAKKEEERIASLKEKNQLMKRGSLKGKWENVLGETRKAEKDKVDNVKNATISDYQVSDGLVQKRINLWEEMIMQSAASIDRINATMAAARMIVAAYIASTHNTPVKGSIDNSGVEPMLGANNGSPIQTNSFSCNNRIPDSILREYPHIEYVVSGETRIFSSKQLDCDSVFEKMHSMLQINPVPLMTGVYSSSIESSDAKEINMPIEVVSLMFLGEDSTTYVACTVTVQFPDGVNNVVKKVAIFDNEGVNLIKEQVLYVVSAPVMSSSEVLDYAIMDTHENTAVSTVFTEETVAAVEPNSSSISEVDISVVESCHSLVIIETTESDIVVSNLSSVEPVASLTEPNVSSDELGEPTVEPVPTFVITQENDKSESNNLLASPTATKAATDSDGTPTIADEGTGTWKLITSPEIVMSTINQVVSVVTSSVNTLLSEPEPISFEMKRAGVEEIEAGDKDEVLKQPVDEPAKPWLSTPDKPVTEVIDFSENVQVDGLPGVNDEDEEAEGDDELLDTLTSLLPSGVYHFGKSTNLAQSMSNSTYTPPVVINRESIPRIEPSSVFSARIPKTDLRSKGGCDSWFVEDECDSHMLPYGAETILNVSIEDIMGLSCSCNALIIQVNNKQRNYVSGEIVSADSDSGIVNKFSRWISNDYSGPIGSAVPDVVHVAVCGTMKNVLISNTTSLFQLHNEKLFEYVRGAAYSGWLRKWPMRSQNVGRMTRRFFILRDNILSYHKKPPENMKDYLYGEDSYALSSLKLTKLSTASRGYKRWWPCVVISTDNDTCWIRGADKAAESQWIDAVNSSISFLNRKPVFLTKPRVECVWHHECLLGFNCIAMDAITYADFTPSAVPTCLQGPVNSFVISPSGSPDRASTGLKPEVSAPILYQHYVHLALFRYDYQVSRFSLSSAGQVSPSHQVYSVDIGGDCMERKQLEVVPLRGSMLNGYDEISLNLTCVKLLCLEQGSSCVGSSIGTSCVMILAGSGGFVGLGVFGGRKLLSEYDDIDTSVLTQERHSLTRQASLAGKEIKEEEVVYCNMETSRLLQQAEVTYLAEVEKIKKRNLKKDVSEHEPFPAASLNYHSIHSTVMAIAVNSRRMIYVSGDNKGGLCIWKLVTSSQSKSLNSSRSGSKSSSVDGIAGVVVETGLTISSRVEAYINVNTLSDERCTSADIIIESINSVQFFPNGNHLAVSTSKRLLLFTLTPFLHQVNFSESYAGSSSLLSYMKSRKLAEDTPIKFVSWTTLDRSPPGVRSLFSLTITDDIELDPELKDGESSTVDEGVITLWKVLGGTESLSSLRKSSCTLYRFKWSKEMLKLALQKSTPIAVIPSATTL